MGTKAVEFINEADKQKEAFYHILLDLKYLKEMIGAGKLDRKTQRIGAEQEVCFIDSAYRPAPIITEFLKRIDDPHFTTELAQFNLEINLEPLEFTGDCFSKMENNLRGHLKKGNLLTREIGDISLIMTGITPSIRKMDLELNNLTPTNRSKAMIEAMNWLRQKNSPIRINGVDDLYTTDFSNMFQSCNTSFQIHYQVNPDDFIAKYNFSQAIAAPVLAACTNSATLFGKRLWHETRIALFEQAVDTRESTAHLSEDNLRVPFGSKWAKNSVVDMFEDDLAKFKIFLRHTKADDSKKQWKKGEIPKLVNLDVFNSSIFRWTRACYGVLDGKPHLRIENRLLPSGPTIKDEIANSAFWLGLMNGMPKKYENISSKMDFEYAKVNLLKAARYGLDTQFRWLKGKRIKSEDLILKELLPIAAKGLEDAKVHKRNIDEYLGIIENRVKSGKTGSQWVFDTWSKLNGLSGDNCRTTSVTAAMLKRQEEGSPVHEWEIPDEDEFKYHQYANVGQFMSTSLFTVKEDDLLDQTVFSMIKKNLNYLPVADKEGNLKGLLTKTQMLEQEIFDTSNVEKSAKKVKDVMDNNPLTIEPNTSVIEAIKLMQENKIKCLPVKYKTKLAGIITEFDMMHIAEHLLKHEVTD
ncbi:CBS domain-containing protein [Marivirga sp. S37H4]|uniref:CBS domain-containing protein n=1 Tax=Marivirga aurantiaca TaxID=2802615 RepID=A0A935C5F2_9BACT|nr:CBS domain-containing protein [Marivirga aurantiaca]MBK6263816.1 CBS domain-containing protein [Marivirga aurantiaca]